MWNVVEQIWEVPQGQFTFHVGSSSRQLPLVSKSARSTLSECANQRLDSRPPLTRSKRNKMRRVD